MPFKIIHKASDFQRKDWEVHFFINNIYFQKAIYCQIFTLHHRHHKLNYPQHVKRTLSLLKGVPIVQN